MRQGGWDGMDSSSFVELGFYKGKFEVVRCSNWRSTVDADI